MVLFTKLLTSYTNAQLGTPILSMVLFTKLLTGAIGGLSGGRF